VPWYRKPGFKLVAVKDVRRLTGLEPSELLRPPNTQQLTRVDESGAREEFLRVPVELLSKEPDGLRDGVRELNREDDDLHGFFAREPRTRRNGQEENGGVEA
jgi:hypothetical protein